MMRMLQVPELQAAMGFGPEFSLTGGSRRDRIRILGNGVCPPVMQAIVSGLTGQSSRPVRWQSSCRAQDVAVLAS